MKKKIMFLIALIAIGIITATSVYASTVINVKIDGRYNYDLANKVVEISNRERTSRGVSALTMDANLTKIAEDRAKEIALYFSHDRPNGDKWETLKVNGENIHYGSSTAEDAVSEWMSSTMGHRENILEPRFKSIGVGSFTTKSGATYWVQIFGASKAKEINKSTGSKEVSTNVDVKLSYINKIAIYDLQYKKLKVGEEYTIEKAALLTGDRNRSVVVSNSNFKFTSSDTKIATIDNTGKIKGLSNGKVVITASFAGKSIEYEIQVGEIQKEVESLSFTNSSYSMYVGRTIPYSVKVTPSNASTTLKWESSNEDVAVVDEKGNVTTKSVGKTTITVKSSNGKKASFNLTVNDLLVNNLFITDYMNAIYIGDTTTIGITISPKDATEKVKYSSSNENIAKVDSNGVVKGVGVGKVVITASTSKSSDSAEIVVMQKKVVDNTPKEVLIDKVSLNCSEIVLNVGETFTPQVSVSPANITEAVRPTWIGFDYRIAEVYSDGTIKAKSAGEGVVSVIVGKNNVSASCKVKVIAPLEVERLEFPFLPSSLTANEVRGMKVNVYPEAARDNTKLVWSSSKPEVATVTQSGVLFTHASGTTTITVTSSNGVKISANLTVN